MANYVKENAEDFKVVVLTLNDALFLHEDTNVDEYNDDIDYLKNFLGATQGDCNDFDFQGSWFAYIV